jgi:hypothetical protein
MASRPRIIQFNSIRHVVMLLLAALLLLRADGLQQRRRTVATNRRNFLSAPGAAIVSSVLLLQGANPAHATKDCFEDCSSNCKRLAPGSEAYCTLTCRDYCEQPDRRDGLSGSQSSEAAELGWRSGFDLPAKAMGKKSGVPYGEDRPPEIIHLPGIDNLMKSANNKQQ